MRGLLDFFLQFHILGRGLGLRLRRGVKVLMMID